MEVILVTGIMNNSLSLIPEDVKCLNADCFPLAFGVCSIAVLVALGKFHLVLIYFQWAKC